MHVADTTTSLSSLQYSSYVRRSACVVWHETFALLHIAAVRTTFLSCCLSCCWLHASACQLLASRIVSCPVVPPFLSRSFDRLSKMESQDDSEVRPLILSSSTALALDTGTPIISAQPFNRHISNHQHLLTGSPQSTCCPTTAITICLAFVSVLLLIATCILSLFVAGMWHVPAPLRSVVGMIEQSSAAAEEQWVYQYELCPRPDTATDDSDLYNLMMNHFLQPGGSFSFPSFNVSLPALLPAIHPMLNKSSHPRYLEVYVLEAFYLESTHEFKLAIIMLAENDISESRKLHDSEPYVDIASTLMADLILTIVPDDDSLLDRVNDRPDPVVASVTHVDNVRGMFWYHFRSASPIRIAPSADTKRPVLVSLLHPAMLNSSSSDCVESTTANGGTGWCVPPRPLLHVKGYEASSSFLRVSLCSRRYRPVEFSYCSNALHTPDLLPHIASWLSYHAYLGIHRFVIFDRGDYREVLEPFIAAGIVDYRYHPWVNRRFYRHSDNWSQTALIAICSQLHQHTSTYWALFDTDEWLNTPRQSLGSGALQWANPLDADLAAVLHTQPFPSSCLRFVPQTLRLEPELHLDGSLHIQQNHFPYLHCESMLSQAVRELEPRQQQRVRREMQRQMHDMMRQSTNAASMFLQLTNYRAAVKQYERPSMLDVIPIRVFNFEESSTASKARVKLETERQQRLYRDVAAFLNASALSDEARQRELSNLPFHASCPQRFTMRRRGYHTSPKAILRSSAPDLATWIHPQVASLGFVNPNVLRFHHYVNIYMARASIDNETEAAEVLVRDCSMLDVARPLYELNQNRSLVHAMLECGE